MTVPLHIAYETSEKGSGYEARCRVYVAPLRQMFEIRPFEPRTISLPDDVFYDRGIGIRFYIGFIADRKGQIQELSAVASVLQPQEIKLSQSSRWHMIGTIIATRLRTLGASGVKHDCHLQCEPPAIESVGPGGCVVCRLARGVFELCC
jgi:hypothetical protein